LTENAVVEKEYQKGVENTGGCIMKAKNVVKVQLPVTVFHTYYVYYGHPA